MPGEVACALFPTANLISSFQDDEVCLMQYSCQQGEIQHKSLENTPSNNIIYLNSE